MTRFDGAGSRKRQGVPGIAFHRIDLLPPRTPRSETIAGLAAAGEVVAVVGAPGSGKSALAALAARSLADGAPFLGRPVLQGATFYVAAERTSEVERRLRAAASPGTPIYLSGARPQLAEPVSVDELVQAILAVSEDEPLPIRLIVLDTAARCFSGLDENSSRDMGLAAEGMARIVEAIPGAVLLILHHLDKNASAMRGSTALLGAVDLELTVRGSGADRKVTVTKANAVLEGQQLAFRLAVTKADDGLSVIQAEACEDVGEGCQKAVPRLSPDAQTTLEVINSLSADGVVSLNAVREATMKRFGNRKAPAKRKAWSTALKTLAETGRITFSDDGVSVSDA